MEGSLRLRRRWNIPVPVATIRGMLKRMPSNQARALVAAATAMPTSDPRISYPSWYLHRWHFLPEGYLSRRSAAGYENLVRHVYNQGLEASTIRATVSELARLAPRALVEVGCGPGRLLQKVAERGIGHDLVGVDLSPYLLERARRRLKHQRIRLVHADGLALPADEGAFDAAISSHYVGHLPPAVRPLAVAELARVVRPGGHVVAVEHRWHPWPECPGLRRIRHIRQSLGFIGLSVFERTDAIVGTPS